MLSKGCGIPHSRQMRKKKKGSSTSGKLKGMIRTPTQKSYCRRNRSWKNLDYEAVMNSLGKRGKTA